MFATGKFVLAHLSTSFDVKGEPAELTQQLFPLFGTERLVVTRHALHLVERDLRLDLRSLRALADSADIGIVSVTPDVSHAKVGQTVTFTVVEENYGPATAEMDIDGTAFSSNLEATGIDCPLGIAVGLYCEQGGSPRASVTARYMLIVLGAPRVATFTPCITGFSVDDPNLANNCATANVRVIGKIR